MLARREIDLAQQLVVELRAHVEPRHLVAAAALLQLAPHLLERLLLLLELLQRALQMRLAMAFLGLVAPQGHHVFLAQREAHDHELAAAAADLEAVLGTHDAALGQRGLLGAAHRLDFVAAHQVGVGRADDAGLDPAEQFAHGRAREDIATGGHRLHGQAGAGRFQQAEQAGRDVCLGRSRRRQPGIEAGGRGRRGGV